MRWGTNTVGSVSEWIANDYGDTNVVSTTFNYEGSDSTEAQAVYGDFGGGLFHKNGATWELTGLMMGVAGFSGQPDPEENAVFGDTTFAADLSFYRPQIMAIVPEPHSVVLAASGLGGMVLWRLLRRRAATFEAFSGGLRCNSTGSVGLRVSGSACREPVRHSLAHAAGSDEEGFPCKPDARARESVLPRQGQAAAQ